MEKIDIKSTYTMRILNDQVDNASEGKVIFKNIQFEFIGSYENIRLYPQIFSETRVKGNDFLKKNKIIDLAI